jgi:hypothetical protein
MTSFIPPRRKLIELVVLIILAGIFYFIYPDLKALMLFVLGFVWNWTTSVDLSEMLQNRRYKLSLLKTVISIQNLFLRPFAKAPDWVKSIVRIFPAGIFWNIVILINESDMPWWAPFLGSAAFELLQIELMYIRRHKELS